jgi:hypothetical protein
MEYTEKLIMCEAPSKKPDWYDGITDEIME